MQMVEDCIRRIVEREKGKVSSFSEIKDFYDQYLNCRYVEPNDHLVFKHVYQEGRWPGIFQFTSDGARRFCIEAQPENIEDLSAITAIYRPGPLKANVHKKYVEAKRNRDEIVYDHPVIKDVLSATFGFVVYQESFMTLAQKLAGFTPGESDKMRKTLVKKDLTSLGKKSDEKAALEEKFVKGCMSFSGMDYEKSKKLFDTIAFFSLYGFNRSHAISYAIVSYYGAWLSTYYEKDWLATCLQSDNASAEKLAVVMSEIKQQGYQIAPPDINYSGTTWNWSEDLQAFVPPLSSLKGIGGTAMDEIVAGRPYRNLEQLLFDQNGNWYHAKMNKRAFEALIYMEAFSSLEEMKEGKISNHKQLHQIIIDNYGVLKKGRYGMSLKKAQKYEIDPIIDRLIEETKGVEDWTRSEKVDLQVQVSGSAPYHLMFPDDIMHKIRKVEINPISSINPGESGVCWFVFTEIEKKVSKNGKVFYRARVQDDTSYTCWIRIWGESKKIRPYSIWMGEIKNEPSWGISTNINRMRLIEAGSSEEDSP
jgi:DNA polymerase III alpha subunit